MDVRCVGALGKNELIDGVPPPFGHGRYSANFCVGEPGEVCDGTDVAVLIAGMRIDVNY